jgi:hypothetical protein
MNKSSKAIVSLLMFLGVKAFAKDIVVSLDFLRKNQLDEASIAELLKEKYLLASNSPDFVYLNSTKVEQVLTTSQDQELKTFLMWLKSIVGDDTGINQKRPGDMTPSSQDIKA